MLKRILCSACKRERGRQQASCCYLTVVHLPLAILWRKGGEVALGLTVHLMPTAILMTTRLRLRVPASSLAATMYLHPCPGNTIENFSARSVQAWSIVWQLVLSKDGNS